MDDIAQAALGKQIERKSDIIHSLPETADDASSGEQETKVESEDVAGKQKSGAALKNLFSALADGQGRVAASAKEGNLKEKSQSLKTDNQELVGNDEIKSTLDQIWTQDDSAVADVDSANLNQKEKEELGELADSLKQSLPAENAKQGGHEVDKDVEALEGYADALTEVGGLTPEHHEAIAAKLALDLMEDLKISDKHKSELLEKETAFIKDAEIAYVRKRINEVKQEMIRFAQDHPGDKERIRAEAIKRLEDIVDKLPLRKSVIEEQELKLKKSPMLREIVASTDKRELRERIRRALADFIAEEVA